MKEGEKKSKQSHKNVVIIVVIVVLVVANAIVLGLVFGGGKALTGNSDKALRERAAYAYEYIPEEGQSRLQHLRDGDYISQDFFYKETTNYVALMVCGNYDVGATYRFGPIKEKTEKSAKIPVTITSGKDTYTVTSIWAYQNNNWTLTDVKCPPGLPKVEH